MWLLSQAQTAGPKPQTHSSPFTNTKLGEWWRHGGRGQLSPKITFIDAPAVEAFQDDVLRLVHSMLTSQKEDLACCLSSSPGWTQRDAIIQFHLESSSPTSKSCFQVECREMCPPSVQFTLQMTSDFSLHLSLVKRERNTFLCQFHFLDITPKLCDFLILRSKQERRKKPLSHGQ